MIIRDLNILYIHVPKTGGTSITNFFRLHLYGRKSLKNNPFEVDSRGPHFTFQEYIDNDKLTEKQVEKMFTFSTIRHPRDRLLSLYYYDGPGNFVRFYQCMSVFEFCGHVAYHLACRNEKKWILYRPQSDYYWLKDGTKVDILLRTEELNKQFEMIRRWVKSNVQLPHDNRVKVAKKLSLDQRDSDALDKIISTYYQKDLDLYNEELNCGRD